MTRPRRATELLHGSIGATLAVANAVVDALASGGAGARVANLQMPLTSERVWRVLHGR